MSADGPPRAVPRRTVLAGAAVSTATALASAVGGCAGPAAPDGRAVPTLQPATPTRRALPVARTADIPVGGGRVFSDLRIVVTQPSAGEFKAFGIVCTHDSCELNGVSDGTITCPCHGSRFAITDGSVVRGPARTGLRVETIDVDGDSIVLFRR